MSTAPDLSLVLDLTSLCACCTHDSVGWREFLFHLDDHLPAPGAPTFLRVTFTGHSGGAAGRIDHLIRHTLAASGVHDGELFGVFVVQSGLDV